MSPHYNLGTNIQFQLFSYELKIKFSRYVCRCLCARARARSLVLSQARMLTLNFQCASHGFRNCFFLLLFILLLFHRPFVFSASLILTEIFLMLRRSLQHQCVSVSVCLFSSLNCLLYVVFHSISIHLVYFSFWYFQFDLGVFFLFYFFSSRRSSRCGQRN